MQHNLFVKQSKYYILNETVFFKQNHLPQANSCITVINNSNWHAFVSQIQAVSSTELSHQIRHTLFH